MEQSTPVLRDASDNEKDNVGIPVLSNLLTNSDVC